MHIRNHLKLFICEKCGENFSDNYRFSRHKLKHEKQK